VDDANSEANPMARRAADRTPMKFPEASFKLMKKEDEVVYHIKTNDINYTGVVNEIVRNYWKDIAWNSKELDKMGVLFKTEEK
jgi:hypothetical protein